MANIISHRNIASAPSPTRRRANSRLFFIIIIVLLSGYFLGIMTSMAFSRQQHEETRTFHKHIVACNDTLWSITAEYCDDNTNIQSLMHDIAKLNNLDSNFSISPGQVLHIPIDESARHN